MEHFEQQKILINQASQKLILYLKIERLLEFRIDVNFYGLKLVFVILPYKSYFLFIKNF